MKKILNDIKTKTFERVYLLTGDEPYLISFLSEKLKEALAGQDTMNVLEMTAETVDPEEARSFTDTMPFFADRRVVLVNEANVFQTASDAYASWIKSLPETANVIFTESAADKRSALYKAVASNGYVAELNHPTEREKRDFVLKKISKAGLKIRKSAFESFTAALPEDYASIANETEKLIDYALDKGEIGAEDVEACVVPKIEERVFQMIDEASRQNMSGALNLYYDLIRIQEPVPRIMANLVKKITQIQNAESLSWEKIGASEAAKLIGVPDFVYPRLVRCAASYGKARLDELLDCVLDLETRFKSGRLSDRVALELMIFKLSEKTDREMTNGR
ncbi:MAG: DNA polymerase III subunit delta [Lachnospiraceae bacterium]|nr:DNA polymerase III subunit delta [Lachnospiraceae bacterium]